jgi:hypothetical protein
VDLNHQPLGYEPHGFTRHSQPNFSNSLLLIKQFRPRRIGNQFWLVAEHGMKAGYVRNIEHDPRVRLKLREGLRTLWHTGTAHLLPDDDPRERQRWLKSQLPSSAGNSRAVRLFGTQLLSIRVDLDG